MSGLAVLVFGAALVVGPGSEAGAFDDLGDGSAWTKTVVDTFDGPAGAAINPSTWQYRTGNEQSWNGNKEVMQYTSGTENVALTGDGRMAITARRGGGNYHCAFRTTGTPGPCEFTSGFVQTTARPLFQPYGRAEAMVQLPADGRGLNPSFWAMGSDQLSWPHNQEIDIFESVAGSTDCKLVCSGLHGPKRQYNDTDWKDWASGPPIPVFDENPAFAGVTRQTLSGSPHLYAVEWSPDRAEFSVDGKVFNIARRSETPEGSWVFDQPFYLMLNVAVGGNWPGNPPADMVFPQTMYVDYVNVYTPKKQLAQTGLIKSPYADGKCVDAVWGSSDNGTRLQITDCKGRFAAGWMATSDNRAQHFSVLADGTIRSALKSKVCLDVQYGGTANGTPVQLWDCNGSASQQWETDALGRLVYTSGAVKKCLMIENESKASGALLTISDCNANGAQVWALPVQPAAEWALHDRVDNQMHPVNVAHDSSGGPNTAQCTGGHQWSKDPARNWVAEFNGGACATQAAVLDTTKNFTVSAWAKINPATTAANANIVGQDGTQVSSFYLGLDGPSKKWTFKRPTSDSTATGWASAESGQQATDTWTHLTAVYDATAKKISLYLNGVYQSSQTLDPSWTHSGPLSIGRGMWAGGPADPFPGKISSVQVWQDDLSAATVAELHRIDTAKPNP